MIAVVQFSLTDNKHPVYVADGTNNRIRIGEHVGYISKDGEGWYPWKGYYTTYDTPGEAAERELKEWLNAKARQ